VAFFQILGVVDDIVWRNASRLKELSESLTNILRRSFFLFAASFVLAENNLLIDFNWTGYGEIFRSVT
jgi:hypothetical protein